MSSPRLSRNEAAEPYEEEEEEILKIFFLRTRVLKSIISKGVTPCNREDVIEFQRNSMEYELVSINMSLLKMEPLLPPKR